MTLDPNVDRRLAELWAISDDLVVRIRSTITLLKAQKERWEPRPCPPREEFP